MSFFNKSVQANDSKPSTTGKTTTLNPNAAEFVPFALRSPSTSSIIVGETAKSASLGSLGKAVLGRTESSVSNNSDEEARQFWSSQLPDDITPDFKVTGDESQGVGSLSLSGLSIHDATESSRFTTPAGGGFILTPQQELSPHRLHSSSFKEKSRYPISSFHEDPMPTSFLNSAARPWDRQIVNNDQLISNGKEGFPYNENSGHGFANDMLNETGSMDDREMNPFEYLASQYPGFAMESLAEVYFANQCDLNLTVEMLNQLELQVDGNFNHNLSSKTSSPPNLSAVNFPSLSEVEGQNGLHKYAGEDLQQSAIYHPADNNLLMFKSSSSMPTRGSIDFASAVKKLAAQDSGVWKSNRHNSAETSIGSSRSSHLLSNSFNSANSRATYGDKMQNRGSSRAPVWLETGEAVANMYSELREEARDHARLRNACFDQAQQAFLIGNKALAKELSMKGQLHGMQMKAAHGKAQESIYRQRNPTQGNGRGQEKMIDLHGLHVSEAINVLKHELGALRSAARSADQRVQVYICVGTGHHTKGTRTPARLPVAVQRYLLEEEGLDYSEPQPGLLRVVIY